MSYGNDMTHNHAVSDAPRSPVPLDDRNGNRRWATRLRAGLHGVALAVPLALLLVLPARAAVGCEDVGALLRRAYPKATPTGDGFDLKGAYAQHVSAEAVACKVWPADPSMTLMAVPLVEANPDPAGDTRGDIEILVLASSDGHPLARRVEKDMALSSAIRFEGVSLDTARYDVRPGLRAFGLRTELSGSSRVNPFSETALWLYTFENGRLARVLDGLIVEQLRGENDGDCAGESLLVRRAVSLGTAGGGGNRDLVVDETGTDEVSKKVDGRCRSTRTPSAQVRQVLRFGGARYEAPADRRPRPDHPEDSWFSLIMTPLSSPAPPPAASATANGRSTASPRPSFDCAKAASKVEKTICASAPLAKADADVDALYRERQRELDPATSALLAEDERYFLAARERVFGYGMGADDPPGFLLDVLKGRADFLRGLRVPSGDGVVGSWGDVAGIVKVMSSGSDRFSVDVNGNEPVTARWVCDAHGTGRLVDGVLEIAIEDDGSKLRLSRDGQTLKVQAVPPPNKTSWTPGYCGLNGSVEGRYFSVPPSK